MEENQEKYSSLFDIVSKMKIRTLWMDGWVLGTVIYVEGFVVKSKRDNNIINIQDLTVLATYMIQSICYW